MVPSNLIGGAGLPRGSQIKEQAQRLWREIGQMSPNQRLILVAAAAFGVLGLVLLLARLTASSPMVTAFSGLSAQDSAAVTSALSQAKIPYTISADGTSISVPSADAGKARVDAASQGLPKGANSGWSLFDKSQLGQSNFQNQVMYLQALEGEIDSSLDGLNEVKSARVEIVLPKQSLFLDQSTPATAAVFLRLRPFATLSSQEVRGIVYMVSHSVQGLSPKNVTVVNQDGNILNSAAELQSGSLSGNLALTNSFDHTLQSRLTSMLETVLGPGNVVAQVSATLNFNKETIDKKFFTPASKTGLITQLHQTTSSSKGAGSSAPAGTGSNIPTYVSGGGGNSSSASSNTSKTIAVNETTTHTVIAPGAVQKLNVAVVVNHSLKQSQQAALLQTVKAAIGYDPARKDQISVVTLPFNRSLQTAVTKQMATQNTYSRIRLLAELAGGLGFLVVLFLLGRAFMHGRKRAEEIPLARVVGQDFGTAPARHRESEATAAMREQHEAAEQALEGVGQRQPEVIADILRTWLEEE